jgi:hypothetical protein
MKNLLDRHTQTSVGQLLTAACQNFGDQVRRLAAPAATLTKSQRFTSKSLYCRW